MTCVIPDMDPTRPASVDPRRIVEAIQNQGVTNTFGSPALWKVVGTHCRAHQLKLPSIKRILMAGAPVSPTIMELFEGVLSPEAEIHTPYGATESLPIASISHREVLDETAEKTRRGEGTCVGKALPGADIQIIRIGDEPIDEFLEDLVLPEGEVGEITVRGDVVTREYFEKPEATAGAKMRDGSSIRHRMGDLGYKDSQGRIWFCGRKAHRVMTADRLLFTVCCEAIFNEHPRVAKTALVGIGSPPAQRPVLVVEPEIGEFSSSPVRQEEFRAQLLRLGQIHEHTRGIRDILFHRSLPVDSRHNVKIHREELATWAEREIEGVSRP